MKIALASVILWFFLPWIATHASAQEQTHLSKRISLTVNNEALPAVLDKLARAGGFTFSYASGLVDPTHRVSMHSTDKSVAQILDELFKGTVLYKERGGFIILTRAPQARQGTVPPAVVAGQVTDALTGAPVGNASVYSRKFLTGVVTDPSGNFSLQIDKPGGPLEIMVSKAGYQDTLVMVAGPGNHWVAAPLKAILPPMALPAPLEVTEHQVEEEAEQTESSTPEEEPMAPARKRIKEQLANILNIRDPLHRGFQMSLVPFVGSNSKLSGNVVNEYSLNILGGYARAVNKAEFGGLFNINRENGPLFQAAGIFNQNGTDQRGGQLAGVYNINGGTQWGLQGAGVFNLNRQGSQGVQLAGVANLHPGGMQGGSVAGVANVSLAASQGVQVAGVFNVQHRALDGSQVAGVLNLATDELTGSQVGLFNMAREIRGGQVGLINVARQVRGSQVGLFNVADSVRGVPVGLMSFVAKGYHSFDVYADEIFLINGAFRSGVRQFYNILLIGLRPESARYPFLWTFGYGVGSSPRISDRLSLLIDLTAQQVSEKQFTPAINLLNRLALGTDLRLGKHLAIFAAGQIALQITRESYEEYPELFSWHIPKLLTDTLHTSSGLQLRAWIGAKAGIRVF